MHPVGGAALKPRTLRYGLSALRRAHAVALLLAALSIMAAGFVGMLLCLPAAKRGAFAVRALEGIREQAVSLEGGIILVLCAILAMLALRLRTARLRVSADGLQGYVPRWCGLGLQGETTGRFRIGWDSIRSVRLVSPGPRRKAGRFGAANAAARLGAALLEIETDDGGRTLLKPFPWVDHRAEDHRLSLREGLPRRHIDVTRRMADTPLVEAFRQRGLQVRSATESRDEAPVSRAFDLTHHTGLMAQVALLFLSGGYALVDALFLTPFRPLGPMPWLPFAVVTAAGVALASVLGRGAPATERTVVGTMTVTALTATVYPAMLRINAVTAQPRPVTYTAVAPAVFRSGDGRLPDVDLSDMGLAGYWAQYPPGAGHGFTLLRGAGGFYQLDLRPVYRRTRRFHGGNAD